MTAFFRHCEERKDTCHCEERNDEAIYNTWNNYEK